LILNHSDLGVQVRNEQDRELLIGSVSVHPDQDGSRDEIVTMPIGTHGVGEEDGQAGEKNYEALWRAYNQFREIAFMKNDGFEFPVVFSSFDAK
jgi:hypothetical protein